MIVDLERKWLKRAKCKETNTDLFFADHAEIGKGFKPSKLVAEQWEEAKEVCIECPVMVECMRDAIGEPLGVWGGLDPVERRDLRAKRSLSVQRLPQGSAQRRQYAALAHRLANTPRYGNREAARIMGLSLSLVGVLVAEHQKVIDAAEAARKAKAKVVDLPLPDAPWPKSPPSKGDGWIRRRGDVSHAYYLGETEDGAWFYMKSPISGREDSLSWFKRRDVQLTRDMPRVVKHRVGEQSRIYGTTISPKRPAAKAG